jgi:hypothetical protein
MNVSGLFIGPVYSSDHLSGQQAKAIAYQEQPGRYEAGRAGHQVAQPAQGLFAEECFGGKQVSWRAALCAQAEDRGEIRLNRLERTKDIEFLA